MSDEGAKTLFRAVIALFAAVVGFGLKAILDVDPHAAPELRAYRWPLFGVLLLLALRIVCGASFQMTTIYIDAIKGGRKESPPLSLLWRTWSLGFQATVDVAALLVFGVSLLVVAASTSLEAYFWRLLAATAIILVWGCADATYRTHRLLNSSRYVFINLVYGACVFASCMALHGRSAANAADTAQNTVFALLGASLIAAWFDIRGTLGQLLDPPEP